MAHRGSGYRRSEYVEPANEVFFCVGEHSHVTVRGAPAPTPEVADLSAISFSGHVFRPVLQLKTWNAGEFPSVVGDKNPSFSADSTAVGETILVRGSAGSRPRCLHFLGFLSAHTRRS